jgi:hypothetical protein
MKETPVLIFEMAPKYRVPFVTTSTGPLHRLRARRRHGHDHDDACTGAGMDRLKHGRPGALQNESF